jgi:hypothetical protein
MGYFDALTSSSFKTAPDGSQVFFPWGVMGRGYVIPSQQDYERLRQQLKTYMIVIMVLIIGTVASQQYIAAFVVAAGLIIFHQMWIRYQLRGLQRSDERLTVNDSFTTQARTHSLAGLWLLEIISLVFVATGISILVVEPEKWLIAVACIIFFGFCAAVFARMLVLRRRGGPADG